MSDFLQKVKSVAASEAAESDEGVTGGAADNRPRCSKCGHPWPVPSLDSVIAGLRAFQLSHPAIFHWPEGELARLKAAMKPGDVFVAIYAFSVRVRHLDGSEFEFKRQG